MKFLILLGYILSLGVSSEFNLIRNNCICPPGAPVCGSDWKTYFGECFMRCLNPGASVLFLGPCAHPSRQVNSYQQPNPYLLPTPFTSPSAGPSYLPNLYPSIRNQFPSLMPYTTPSLPSPYSTPSPSPLRSSESTDDDEFDPLMAQRRSMSDFFSNADKAEKVYDVIKKGLQLVEEVKDVISQTSHEAGSTEHAKVAINYKDGEDVSVNDNVKDDEHLKDGEDVKTGEDVTDGEVLKDVEDVTDAEVLIDAEDKNVFSREKAIDVKDAVVSKAAEYKNEAQTAIETKEVEVPSTSAAPEEA